MSNGPYIPQFMLYIYIYLSPCNFLIEGDNEILFSQQPLVPSQASPASH